MPPRERSHWRRLDSFFSKTEDIGRRLSYVSPANPCTGPFYDFTTVGRSSRKHEACQSAHAADSRPTVVSSSLPFSSSPGSPIASSRACPRGSLFLHRQEFLFARAGSPVRRSHASPFFDRDREKRKMKMILRTRESIANVPICSPSGSPSVVRDCDILRGRGCLREGSYLIYR